MNRCKKCGNVFTENGSEFCSPGHRRQYERKNKLCSYPQKRAFVSELLAWEWINKNADRLFMENLGPFSDCSCGKIHIGHSNKGKVDAV